MQVFKAELGRSVTGSIGSKSPIIRILAPWPSIYALMYYICCLNEWLLQAAKRGPTLKLGTNETSTNAILQANNYFAEQLALLTRNLFLRSKT